ncbi:MAG: UPF0755 protein [Candidatus Berkelbacteria bacterium Licking1014_7]|uniref:Endolytic murein transglycosylase n=1 Tax=Candidatus Berkelbacteria bacterium Licking1014_7 TaxID=2017147 RepID=A0A554LIS7_9BACT|nr:MAG: UPF0755 protein [Candidatus Berkelbacteria bacterium Licking1014_7]
MSDVKKKRFWVGLVGVIVLAIAIVSGAFYREIFLSRAGGTSSQKIFVEIDSGQSTRQIAQTLKEKDIISRRNVFLLYVKLKRSPLRAGLYYFSSSQTIAQIAKILQKGEVSENSITIPEGWRREQIAQYLSDRKITTSDDFLSASEGREGYLFPDTYRLAVSATAEQIVEKMTENFAKRIEGLNILRNDLILASIIEREAKRDDERLKIAGVYKNRLALGMKLEADPTVQYARDNEKSKSDSQNYSWWQIITRSDYLSEPSNFNTYLHSGLPPAPICSPGLKSIQAVKNPEKHNYYYFFHLKDGTAIFSKTLSEHNENLAKYVSER